MRKLIEKKILEMENTLFAEFVFLTARLLMYLIIVFSLITAFVWSFKPELLTLK